MELIDKNEKKTDIFDNILIKINGKYYEISSDRKIIDLLNLLLKFESGSDDPLSCKKNYNENFVIQINHTSGIKIKSINRNEFLCGKSDLEEIKHPFFSDTKNQSKKNLINITNDFCEKNLESFNKIDLNIENANNINNDFFLKNHENSDKELKDIIKNDILTVKKKSILTLDKSDKILLFTPHPDDEILGACGLLYKCFNESYNIKIVYMTSGKGGGQSNVRKMEAIEGIKILGGTVENLIFSDIPFYDKKDRVVTDEDYDYVSKIIEEENPANIFICSDVFDPNKTHRKCYDVLMQIYNSKKYENMKYYFYYSVWYWPKPTEYSHILPYDYENYRVKICAMLEHKSQLLNQFMGDDPRPFYQRAITRDNYFGKIHNYNYCEIYLSVNDHFNDF